MPDVIRSIADLNALLADNGTGNLSAQDIRDLMVSMMVHGELGSGAKSPVALTTGYHALDLDTAGAFERGLNIDTENGRIDQIPVDMKAVLTLELYFKGDAGEAYDFTVYKDPAVNPVEITSMRRAGNVIVSPSQTYHLSYSVGVQLSANDVLQPAVRSDGNNFELLFGLFRVQRIGVE